MLCPQCGQENPDGFRFCGSCGVQLGKVAASEERKVVTVLFADLVGFTSRSERMDVEDVRGTLAPFHTLLRDELEHYGGTVEKFIGDAVMAVFGAPAAHEDDPERAVRAALSIRAAIDRLNETEPVLDLHVRVGVNTGEALVVLSADAARGEAMVSGDVVNTAARLQAAAPVDGILVGEATYRATDRAVTYRSAEPVIAKGKNRPVVAWEALEARARLGVDVVQRPTTPLVGRGEEIGLVRDAFRRCRAESAVQLVTIVGVPGIGKSRLVWELLQAVERDPDFVTWRQGRSLPYGDGVTFWALGEMVKAQAGILDSDTTLEAEGKLRGTISDLFPDRGEAAWVEEHLRALAGLEVEAVAGDDRSGEAASAFRRFFEALAETHPLVLVFDDIHWADDALLDFIDHLVDWAGAVPMLVVCTTRPELLDRRRGWGGGKRNALTIALSPLPDAEIARLIGALLEQAVMPVDTQVQLLRAAAGNPLYAEEYVRMLMDVGHLRLEGGRWRLAAGVELPVPESVQGLIAARLDDLPAEEKGLIQDASVLGKVVWLGALAAMSDTSPFVLEERLHALERREMLRRERRSSVGGEVEYAFRHILMRDVAYGQIPRARRAAKHRRAAEWIESLAADRENAPDMLAHHYSQALEYARDSGQPTEELQRRARIALREAAERAAVLNSFAVSQRHYLAALALWPEDDADWPATVVAAADVGGLSAPSKEMSLALRKARDRLLASGDRGLAAKAEMLAAFRCWNEGMGEEARAAFAFAGELLEGAAPSPTVARVISRLAIFAMLRGEFDATIGLCARALAIADDLDLREIRAHLLNTQGVARIRHGDLAGLTDLESSVEIAEGLNAAEAMIRGYKNLGSVLGELGELGRATEFGQRGVEAAHRFGADYQVVWFESELAILAYLAGDWDSADEAFARLDTWVAEVGPHYMESAVRTVRALMGAARGDSSGAHEHMERALDFARRANEPQLVLPALADAALMAASMAGRDAGLQVAALVEELAGARAGGEAGSWTAAAALALALTDQPELFAGIAVDGPSRWVEPARLLVTGQFRQAADALATIGGRPMEAFARLLEARSLISTGQRDEGEAELQRALDFWSSVRATRHCATADALLARTA